MDGIGSQRPLLIAIGNPLRGDDGVAAVLLEELAEELGGWSTPAAELQAVHQLTPELSLALAQASRVLFLDACVSSRTTEPWIEPLGLAQSSLDSPSLDSPSLDSPGLSTHSLEPSALQTLACTLYGWKGEGSLLRVPAFAFPHGTGFSSPLQLALPRARWWLRRWLQGDGP